MAITWQDVGKGVANIAPLLGTLIGGPAGAAIGRVIAGQYGTKPEPAEVLAVIKADPEAQIKLTEILLNHQETWLQMHFQHDQKMAEEDSKRLESVNATYRSELAQEDLYTKRWRPTYGYAMAFSWTVLMLATAASIIYITFWHPVNTGEIFKGLAELYSSMIVLWTVALSVTGVSVYQRSKDKQGALTRQPEAALIDKLKSQLPAPIRDITEK